MKCILPALIPNISFLLCLLLWGLLGITEKLWRSKDINTLGVNLSTVVDVFNLNLKWSHSDVKLSVLTGTRQKIAF